MTWTRENRWRLAVVIIGEDPASQVYVRNKVRQTEECGMRSLHHHLPTDATQFEVENLIADLNADPEVDGILLQLPLPKGVSRWMPTCLSTNDYERN